MLHAAVEQCRPGDVLVVATMSRSTDGMFGELLATALRTRGVIGIVIDAGVRDVAEGTGLMTDLDHAITRALVRGAHGFGLVDREGHGLFLINVLAGVHGGNETFGVQMLWGGN